MQAQILRECVENQTPDIIICDEISTSEEVEAARTIAQRGVRLIASVHGNTLPELVNDSERRNLVGGQTSVTLTDRAADARMDKRKTVALRLREPSFTTALELHEREVWVYHPDVATAIDNYYNAEPVEAHVLVPGKILACVALSEHDKFSYCLDCAATAAPCSAHAPQVLERAIPRSMQGSGKCYHCGEQGHMRMYCPRRVSGL